jgi:membrane-bound lytic murein transglycosylase B
MNLRKYVSVFFLLTIFLLTQPRGVFAFTCSDLNTLDLNSKSEADLRQYLIACESEKAQIEQNLNTQKQQSAGIQTDVNAINAINNRLKSSIKARTTVINKLGTDINQKVAKIETLSEKMDKEKSSLSQLIIKTNMLDNTPLISVVLSDKTLSDFYKDFDTFAAVQEGIKGSLDMIRGVKTETESEKAKLKEKQDAEIDVKFELEQNKKQVEKNEAEKKKLLSLSKQKESEYQKLVAERAAKSAQIRAKLFSLRDTAAIPFGDALDYANAASKKTGVRPAFLLAILTQESNLGANQGSCYLTDPATGAGIGSKSGTFFANVMKPTRDVQPFLAITASVGRDYLKTLVSCPIAGGGYGGAMGPSQFIPSTWNIFKNRVATALGIDSADPWNPRDAFMASGIYLGDLGASTGTFTSEKNAACKYYSGRSCDNKKPANSFYGTSVMAKANDIQTNMIDPLKAI